METPHRFTLSQLAEQEPGVLGRSRWLRMTQDRIDEFARATEDFQWIHVDPERAASGPFGRTIAHGYLTLAMIPHLMGDVFEITDQVRGANYGTDRIRFTGPVPVDSEIQLVLSFVEAVRRDDGGVAYKLGVEILQRGGERPVLVGEVLYLGYSS